MITIYKYTLELTEYQNIQGIRVKDILTAQVQNNKIVLWVKISTSAPIVNLQIRIAGTGNEFNDGNFYTYISTIQLESFVWHIFYAYD